MHVGLGGGGGGGISWRRDQLLVGKPGVRLIGMAYRQEGAMEGSGLLWRGTASIPVSLAAGLAAIQIALVVMCVVRSYSRGVHRLAADGQGAGWPVTVGVVLNKGRACSMLLLVVGPYSLCTYCAACAGLLTVRMRMAELHVLLWVKVVSAALCISGMCSS